MPILYSQSGTTSPATATQIQLMELTMQLMTMKATKYHAICFPRLPLLRNTKFFWMGKLMISPMAIAII